MEAPEEAFAGMSAEATHDLADCEAFPGCAALRMAEEIVARGYAEHGVQQAAVREVDLGRLDLALADVLVPGRQANRNECRDKKIEISAHRLLRHAESPSELGRIPR